MRHIKNFKIFESRYPKPIYVDPVKEEYINQYIHDVLMELEDDGLDCRVIEDPLNPKRPNRCWICIVSDNNISFLKYREIFEHINSFLISEEFEINTIQLYKKDRLFATNILRGYEAGSETTFEDFIDLTKDYEFNSIEFTYYGPTI